MTCHGDTMHAAWSVLFNDPDFWHRLDKEHFCSLTSVCKTFRADIPQRVAILSLFENRMVKKVNLFRIMPLSVHDVMSIRSPVNFTEVATHDRPLFESIILMMRRACSRRSSSQSESREDSRTAWP
jgi:hypothetical protein